MINNKLADINKVKINIMLHLYWIDNSWKKNHTAANNFNLLVDFEHKVYRTYTNPYYGYHNPEDIKVNKKSDIKNYIEYLKMMEFRCIN